MKKQLTLYLAIAFITLTTSGCGLLLVGAAGGAGTAYWLSQKLTDQVNASFKKTISATKKALASLKMPIKKDTKTDKVNQIISEYADGSKVWIDIRPITETYTKIEIRVGLDGDELASTTILKKIKSKL